MFNHLKARFGLGSGRQQIARQDAVVPPALAGAYRLHRTADVPAFTALAKAAFPQWASRITCFGADWLGRQFATDTGRIRDGEPQVLLLEPGTGEILQIPADYGSFHSRELVENPDAAVACSFYQDWVGGGGASPAYDQCVGYRLPLYLGGVENVTNLELCDFDVYWALAAQLLAQTRGLPAGAPIRRVSISD